ncbi:hypothetical protein NQZ68_004237 [Dissostichus eleginoides]|nr:hypothetical protein NQZ68_004237 [Dissostichus eleginoides]
MRSSRSRKGGGAERRRWPGSYCVSTNRLLLGEHKRPSSLLDHMKLLQGYSEHTLSDFNTAADLSETGKTTASFRGTARHNHTECVSFFFPQIASPEVTSTMAELDEDYGNYTYEYYMEYGKKVRRILKHACLDITKSSLRELSQSISATEMESVPGVQQDSVPEEPVESSAL